MIDLIFLANSAIFMANFGTQEILRYKTKKCSLLLLALTPLEAGLQKGI